MMDDYGLAGDPSGRGDYLVYPSIIIIILLFLLFYCYFHIALRGTVKKLMMMD